MKTWLRRLAIAFGVLCLLALALIAIGPPKVPAEAIASSVHREADLLERAWKLPVASQYRRALGFQSNGSLCGPASLASAFRSLGFPSYEKAVLEDSGLCWSGMCFMGLTLDELGGLAKRRLPHGVRVLRDLNSARLREHLRRSNDPKYRYLVNFHRKPIFGAGGGHHSPIGGYLEEEDLVFVLDVNRDFQPWLVEREKLFAAIDTIDSQSDRKRGLLMIHHRAQ